MEIYKKIELSDCPQCGGDALLEEEPGTGYFVTCVECGSHSVIVDFKDDNEDERLRAAQSTAELWNTGRVISSARGE